MGQGSIWRWGTMTMANRDKMISEAVRLRKGGMKFDEIGKRMGIGRETARYLFALSMTRSLRLAEPGRERLPMMTMAGMLWQWPPVRPKGRGEKEGVCDRCEVLERCMASVALGGFIGCERPLKREMVARGDT
jgi:hypothetical protein